MAKTMELDSARSGPRSDKTAAISKLYSAMQSKLNELSYLYGEKAGLAQETMLARLDIELTTMMERINNDNANISILMNDYATVCKQAVDDPEARMRYRADR